jgi:rieske iron-sulfur protein
MNRRRDVLKAGLGLGLGASFVSLRAQENEASARPKQGDLLVKADDNGNTPLTPDDIKLGVAQTRAWAMNPATGVVRSGSRLNQVILLRLDPASLTSETRGRAADGVVAYTAICTHEGCDVDTWLDADQAMACSCHSSTFDPKDAAKVLEGPASRMLPALPLKVTDGKLVVAAPFTARVGADTGAV